MRPTIHEYRPHVHRGRVIMAPMTLSPAHICVGPSASRRDRSVFDLLTPETYVSHQLHGTDRDWSETNCFTDVWIETVHTCGQTPEAMLGFTLAQDFEGDQFTFAKPPLGDIEELYGIRTEELAIYDSVEGHILGQVDRGRLAMVELDSYHLPDTRGTMYRTEHGKTMVAVNRIDPTERELEYFHNGGYHRLSGEDYVGLLRLDLVDQHHLDDHTPFLPYAEYARFPAEYPDPDTVAATARTLLRRHHGRRPDQNPFEAYAEAMTDQVAALAERPFAAFHLYAFNTVRQYGANFELAASHLQWLSPDFSTAAEHAREISRQAKALQFKLARAVMRADVTPLVGALEPTANAWDALMSELGTLL